MSTDSTKTGRLIAAQRKEKGLTQMQLAQKLQVTDKAISRWETGKGLPDSTLMLPLCAALGLSVNELLAGVKSSRQEALTPQQAAEEAVLHAAAYTDSKMRLPVRPMEIAGKALMGFGLLLCLLCFTLLSDDTSWVSVYSCMGAFLMAAGSLLWSVCHFKRKLVCFILPVCILLSAFTLFEVRDYVNVRWYARPPLYSSHILTYLTGDVKVICYDKLFYDVYRYMPDTPQEYYRIE